MSKETKKIAIKESELVELINKIVNEVVTTKKTQWIAEQRKRKTGILENRIAALEKRLVSTKK